MRPARFPYMIWIGTIVLLPVLGCSTMFAAHVDVVEEIVCKVNGDIITRNDLDHDRKGLEQQLRQQNLAGTRLQDVLNSKMADLLRDRIDRLLMVQKGKEMDLKVDADLNKQMAEYQRRSGIADPQKFQDWVKEQWGKAYEDFRGDMKNKVLTDGVIQEEIIRKIQFKKEELQAYYEQHKDNFQRQERVFLREIFINTAGKDAVAQAAAEKKAKDLSARAKKGEKFADLAQSNSDDAATAQEGGVMPPYEKGKMLPELETAVWDQPRSFVSDPIKLPSSPWL